MSANDHTTAHEEAHTGPIRTPKQLLMAVFFSFFIPVFAIIGLVYYVTSANKPLAGAQDDERSVARRIQKVGMIEIRDANRPLKSGEEVYKAQCVTCHAAGVAGAPKFADAGAWAPRIAQGFETLWNSSLKGKGAMGPQGGGDFEDLEIGRAVVYLTASAGGKFPEPTAAPAVAAAGPAGSALTVPSVPAVAVVAAAATPSATSTTVATAAATSPAAGEALYKQACFACHAAGVAGAPKLGDKTAWAPRLPAGIDALTASVIKGKGAMPPKGGSAAPDADIHAAVEYMVSTVK